MKNRSISGPCNPEKSLSNGSARIPSEGQPAAVEQPPSGRTQKQKPHFIGRLVKSRRSPPVPGPEPEALESALQRLETEVAGELRNLGFRKHSALIRMPAWARLVGRPHQRAAQPVTLS